MLKPTPQPLLRITSCSDSLRWYASLVGQTVTFVRREADAWVSREPAGYINFIDLQDARLDTPTDQFTTAPRSYEMPDTATLPRATTFKLADLPSLGQPLDDGTFQGITTSKDGTHCAVILLDAKPTTRLAWQVAKDWAQAVGGQLPTRPVAALLYANAKPLFQASWHWTSDELQDDTNDKDDASFAWSCYFSYGSQFTGRKSAEGAVVAVRLIPLTA